MSFEHRHSITAHDRLGLDDARPPKGDPDDRMHGLHRDEQRHVHAEQRLDELMVQRSGCAAEQQRHDVDEDLQFGYGEFGDDG